MSDFPGFLKKTARIVAENPDSLEALSGICEVLSGLCRAGVLVCGEDGLIAAEKLNEQAPVVYRRVKAGSILHADKLFVQKLNSVHDDTWNLPLYTFSDKGPEKSLTAFFALCIPLVSGLTRLGTLFMWKPSQFTDGDYDAALLTSAFGALFIGRYVETAQSLKAGSVQAVKRALDSLSYSELSAAIAVFETLGYAEGRVVASKIAADYKVTRSAIVNALRKLASADLVETRSLGVKGTFIAIKNPELAEEFKKFGRTR